MHDKEHIVGHPVSRRSGSECEIGSVEFSALSIVSKMSNYRNWSHFEEEVKLSLISATINKLVQLKTSWS